MISRLGNDRLAICLKGTKPPGLLEFEVMIHSFASLRDMIQLMNKETQRSFRWAMVKNHVCSKKLAKKTGCTEHSDLVMKIIPELKLLEMFQPKYSMKKGWQTGE